MLPKKPITFWFACVSLAIAVNAGAQPPTKTLTVSGAGSLIRAAKSFSQAFEKMHPGVGIVIEPGRSRTAIRAVRAGKLKIGLLGHALAPADTRGLHIEAIEKQAILVVTYPTNPVKSLQLAQIRSIYSGGITNWHHLGGENQVIVPFTRRKSSMIRQIFMSTLGNAPSTQETAFRIAKDKVLKTIKKIQGSLGYASTSLKKAREGGIKVLAVNGRAPTRQNVQQGTYPFSRTLLVITAARPDTLTSEWIRGFVKFVRQESSARRP